MKVKNAFLSSHLQSAHLMLRPALLFIVIFGVLCLPAYAKRAQQSEALDTLHPDPQTTSQPWAAPLEGGPIRALFIAPRYTLRDVIDLGARIELEYATVPIWDAEHLGWDDEAIPGADEQSTLDKLKSQLSRTWDVVVLGNFNFNLLPADMRAGLCAQVESGAGLILVNERRDMPTDLAVALANVEPDPGSAAITRGIGQELTPEWPINLDFVKSGKHGKGRIVHIDYPGDRPQTSFLLPALSDPLHARDCYRDTYYSLVAKAMRWAAGRDASVAIADVADVTVQGPDDKEIPAGLPEEYIQQIRDGVSRPLYRMFRVSLEAPADQRYTVFAQVREPSRGITLMYPDLRPLEQGAKDYVLELPIGPGVYLLDVRLATRKGRVVEWHSEVIRVSGWPEIENITYGKGFLLPNDTLDVSLDIRPQYSRPHPCVVYARATDSLGRMVSEASAQVGEDGGTAKLTLNFSDLIANLVKVEVFAADTTNRRPSRWELDHAAYATPVYLPVRAPYSLSAPSFAAVSPEPDEYNIRHYLETLKKQHVDSLAVPPTDVSRYYLATADLRPIPELASNAPESVKDHVRQPCISQMISNQDVAKTLRDSAAGFSLMGTSVYNLGVGACLAAGDEEVCTCETCVAGFREWLARRYENVAALNRVWGVNYAGFDQVAPAARDQALETGNYAPWIEFRLYMDSVFAGAMAAAREKVKVSDRYARVGLSALGGSRASLGYDWWQLASQLESPAIPVDPVVVEMIRSFKTPAAAPVLTFGGGHDFNDPAWAHWLPWYQVLHGFGGLWCTSPFGEADMKPTLPALRPDGAPTKVFEQVGQTVADVKQGIGTLLLNAARVKPQIAIYSSQSSLYLNQIDRSFQSDSRTAEERFVRLLEGLGYQYDFISAEQVRQGALARYRVLVMPMVRSLGENERTEIIRFFTGGGAVIADIAPGEFDEHGQRLPNMPMDEVFGVTHKAPPRANTVEQAGIKQADKTVDVAAPGLVVDAAVEGASEGTAGDAGIWFSNGRSFLANHTLATSGMESDIMQRLAKRLGGVLSDAKVTEEWADLGRLDAPFAGECVRFKYGAADILAFLASPADAPETQEVTLKLQSQGYFYNMIGEPEDARQKVRLNAKAPRGGCLFLSALPYEVVKVDVVAPERVQAGTRLAFRVIIKTNGQNAGNHLVHISLTREEKTIPYYDLNAVCTNGETSTFIPLALDEVPGNYELVVKDILSNQESRNQVKIVSLEPPQ